MNNMWSRRDFLLLSICALAAETAYAGNEERHRFDVKISGPCVDLKLKVKFSAEVDGQRYRSVADVHYSKKVIYHQESDGSIEDRIIRPYRSEISRDYDLISAGGAPRQKMMLCCASGNAMDSTASTGQSMVLKRSRHSSNQSCLRSMVRAQHCRSFLTSGKEGHRKAGT
jgi:hypothetical protein